MSPLELPTELIALITKGAWPLTEQESNRQRMFTAPISRELIQHYVPEESEIWLCPPPFRTVAERCASGEAKYWDEFGSLDQVDPTRTLLIGDFGIGTETAIALDYRRAESPPVLRLSWIGGQPKTRWVPFFATFGEFAAALGIDGAIWR